MAMVYNSRKSSLAIQGVSVAEHKPKNTENAEHKVLTLVAPAFLEAGAGVSMLQWAQEWLIDEVIGIQAHNTAIAKRRDLERFFKWFYETNGTLDISDWLPRDTAGFLEHLEKEGKAPATVNRHLATLRRWARWTVETGKSPFSGPIPTKGIKERTMDEPEAKRLTTKEINRLFKAADKLVITDTRSNSRPRRNRAILAVAYYTGLRVSEICGLHLLQYEDNHFKNVIRKGRARTNKIYVSKKCRALLDDYIQNERTVDDLRCARARLFLPSTRSKGLGRLTIWRAFQKLSREASAHIEGEMLIHPHQLRHTFGYEVRQRTGSDTETAALLGHAGLKYVGRYVRKTDEERAEVLDDL
jgi:integrase/recombinase XerD